MRVRNPKRFGDDDGDDGSGGGPSLSTTDSSDLGSGWLTGQTDTSGSGDMLGVPTLSSPEADVTSTPAQLQNTSQGAVLFDNASGSAPTTDAGSSLWGGQSSVGGFLSSLFASGAAATPKAQTVAAQAPGLAAALPFLAGMSTNGLLIGGFGLLAVVLLVKR